MTHEYEKMFNFVAHRSTYWNHKEMPFPSHQIGSKKSENTNSGRQCNNRNFPLPLLPCELALPPGKTSVKQNTGARYSPRFVLLEKPCRWHTQDTRTGVVTPLSWWAERSRGGGSPEPVYRIMNKWSPRVQWNSRAQSVRAVQRAPLGMARQSKPEKHNRHGCLYVKFENRKNLACLGICKWWN